MCPLQEDGGESGTTGRVGEHEERQQEEEKGDERPRPRKTAPKKALPGRPPSTGPHASLREPERSTSPSRGERDRGQQQRQQAPSRRSMAMQTDSIRGSLEARIAEIRSRALQNSLVLRELECHPAPQQPQQPAASSPPREPHFPDLNLTSVVNGIIHQVGCHVRSGLVLSPPCVSPRLHASFLSARPQLDSAMSPIKNLAVADGASVASPESRLEDLLNSSTAAAAPAPSERRQLPVAASIPPPPPAENVPLPRFTAPDSTRAHLDVSAFLRQAPQQQQQQPTSVAYIPVPYPVLTAAAAVAPPPPPPVSYTLAPVSPAPVPAAQSFEPLRAKVDEILRALPEQRGEMVHLGPSPYYLAPGGVTWAPAAPVLPQQQVPAVRPSSSFVDLYRWTPQQQQQPGPPLVPGPALVGDYSSPLLDPRARARSAVERAYHDTVDQATAVFGGDRARAEQLLRAQL